MADSFIAGKKMRPKGITPSVVLINPKYDHNVSKSIRLCSCYGVNQLWYTGDRVQIDPGKKRLLREERMKGYKDVEVHQFDYPLEHFPFGEPVVVEVDPSAELLPYFEHPSNAVYVFGPEDGYVPRGIRDKCHRFVAIPVKHCLNLATAVATVLWDRYLKEVQAGQQQVFPLKDLMEESRSWIETDESGL